MQKSDVINNKEGTSKQKEASLMKATVIYGFGDFNTLKFEDIERPSPKPGHILIKVLATGVNLLDHYN
ncbi:MAG: zinc-binding alcohol dehydrogenase family protein [Bacteroidetes bacterium]|nr:zinc-binding alcohol dehydrogenase family protein [Bacteroidota bacterium]